MSRYILAFDQGTTSSRAIVFGHDGRIVASAQQEFRQIFPQPGHVEHDPEDIWTSQIDSARQALAAARLTANDIAAIGLTNQRETTLVWDRQTGQPIAPAIVWQSRITAPLCQQWKDEGLEPLVRQKTGLVIDAYFSASKIKHLLDTVPGARVRAGRGDLLFGTVDSYLIWRLTGGRVHATDVSNASRTMLFDIHSLEWNDELLHALDVPRAMLPQVRPSSGIFGETEVSLFGRAIPIAGVAGDQQAATFGQACFQPGAAKNTYGTGCFLLMNLGSKPRASQNGLLTTVGWQIGNEVTYCLEGAVFVAGAVTQWLRDGLGIIKSSNEVEALASSVPDTGGVIFIPALVGLGAPHWDASARGMIVGITRGTTAAHIARAAIESIAFQTRDLMQAMRADAEVPLAELKVDGGASRNNLLMQFQADILPATVRRPVVSETTALGAAYLAGLAVGYWHDLGDVTKNWVLDQEFQPRMMEAERDTRIRQWNAGVKRARGWTTDS
jgi:glycerol kinase